MMYNSSFLLAFFLFGAFCANSIVIQYNTSKTFIEQASQIVAPVKFGSCQEGKVYTIKSHEDLLSLSNELLCIFVAGVVPDRVPTGFLYGKMLLFSNTELFNNLINSLYQGDFIYETLCQQQPVFIGEVKFNGVTVGVGEMKISSYSDVSELDEDEYFDRRPNGKDGMIYRFDDNLFELCQPDKQRIERTNFPMLFFGSNRAGLLTDTYPTKIFTDVLRIVGRSSDGALLFLGRTFVKDPAILNSIPTTAYFFLLKSFDPIVNTNFKIHQSLPPVAQSITYQSSGIFTLVTKASPLKYILSLLLRRQTIRVPSLLSWIHFDYFI